MFLLNTAYMHEKLIADRPVVRSDEFDYGLKVRDDEVHWSLANGAGRHIDIFLSNMRTQFNEVFGRVLGAVAASEMLQSLHPFYGQSRIAPEMFRRMSHVKLRAAMVDFINRRYWDIVNHAFKSVLKDRPFKVDSIPSANRLYCTSCSHGWVPDEDGVMRFLCKTDCDPFRQSLATTYAKAVSFTEIAADVRTIFMADINNAETLVGQLNVELNAPAPRRTNLPLAGENRYYMYSVSRVQPVRFFPELPAEECVGEDQDSLSLTDLASINESLQEVS